ncbi:hypothetical protein D5I38_23535 [Salmonella enterica]|nr:hypothetical protein [Salmonella enterica]
MAMADIILIIFMNVFLTCHIRYYYHAANFIAIFSICAFLPVCRLIESCVIFIFFQRVPTVIVIKLFITQMVLRDTQSLFLL